MTRTLLLIAALTWGSAWAGADYVPVSFSGEDGATVILDGRTLGVLPLQVQVQAGVHTFEVVSRTGLTTHVTREIAATDAEPLAVHLAEGEAELKAVMGTVNFFGATGSKVSLGDEVLGIIPLSKELPEGEHTFRIEAPDGEVYELTRAVRFKGKGVPYNLALTP